MLSLPSGEEILKDLLRDEALCCEGALIRAVLPVSLFADAAVMGFFLRKDGSFFIWMLESGQF
jgi:hypothetical protein